MADDGRGAHCRRLVLLVRDFAFCVPRYFEGMAAALGLPLRDLLAKDTLDEQAGPRPAAASVTAGCTLAASVMTPCLPPRRSCVSFIFADS
jgi:hypothetical protein